MTFHGDAVRQTVILVRTPLVQLQPSEKRLVRLGHHLNGGIGENLKDKPASQSPGPLGPRGNRGEELAQNLLRGDERLSR